MSEQKLQQTEIGLIPEDWSIISYNDAFIFLPTATYSRADLSEDSEIFYVHYGDIHTKFHSFLDFDKFSLPSISSEKVKGFSLLEEGDLIIADASEDYAGICKSIEVKNLKDKKAISGLHTFLLRSKKGIFEKGFLGYLNHNRLIKVQFDRLATGLKVYGVSKNNLRRVLIPYPKDPKEQEAIAKALTDADNLIEKLDELITKKKNIKRGAMQELLTGEKRAESFSGTWKKIILGELVEIKKGSLITKNTLIEGRVPVIAGGKTPAYYNKFANRFNKTITVSSSGANAGYVNIFLEPIFASDCSTIEENEKTNLLFIYYQLKLKQDYIYYSQTGGAQPHIHPRDLKPLIFNIPPTKEEQEAIANILSDMDLEIGELKQKKDTKN